MLYDADEHVHCFPTRSGRKMRPEEALAVAVLEDAVRTLQRYVVVDGRAARALVAEVDEWFACNDTGHPFTFVSICDLLALDVAYVRSGLRHWRESQQVVIRTEPRVVHFTSRRWPEEREAPSRLRVAPGPSLVPTRPELEVEMSSGTIDKMKGRVKEAAGALVGDHRLKQEGKADQLVGKVKDIAEKMVDTAKNVVKGRRRS
jgi:uncharacterized protein YjbJ (UPF0337 family)